MMISLNSANRQQRISHFPFGGHFLSVRTICPVWRTLFISEDHMFWSANFRSVDLFFGAIFSLPRSGLRLWQYHCFLSSCSIHAHSDHMDVLKSTIHPPNNSLFPGIETFDILCAVVCLFTVMMQCVCDTLCAYCLCWICEMRDYHKWISLCADILISGRSWHL